MESGAKLMTARPTIIVGDLHGRWEIVESVLDMLDEYDVVFLGDYVDSKVRDIEDQLTTLDAVTVAANAHPDNVTALLGNHELSYMGGPHCSGWNAAMQMHMTPMVPYLNKTLKHYAWVHNYLVTHAGVSAHKLRHYGMTVNEFLESRHIHDIGPARRGTIPSGGGIFWNDFNHEMAPIIGLKQVVGHTNSRLDDDPMGARLYVTGDDNGEIGAVICIDHLDRVPEVAVIHPDGKFDTMRVLA